MTDLSLKLPGLDWKAPIVDPVTGRPSPYFQRFWQNATFNIQVSGIDLSGKADAGTSTGWTPMVGASTKGGGLDVAAVTLPQLAAVVKAVVDALMSSNVAKP